MANRPVVAEGGLSVNLPSRKQVMIAAAVVLVLVAGIVIGVFARGSSSPQAAEQVLTNGAQSGANGVESSAPTIAQPSVKNLPAQTQTAPAPVSESAEPAANGAFFSKKSVYERGTKPAIRSNQLELDGSLVLASYFPVAAGQSCPAWCRVARAGLVRSYMMKDIREALGCRPVKEVEVTRQSWGGNYFPLDASVYSTTALATAKVTLHDGDTKVFSDIPLVFTEPNLGWGIYDGIERRSLFGDNLPSC